MYTGIYQRNCKRFKTGRVVDKITQNKVEETMTVKAANSVDSVCEIEWTEVF